MCELKEKFKEWQEWLFGDDIHSIQNQILAMIWDSAVFQSVNEARRYAPIDAENNPELNGMVHGFINHCFFQTQALAIRRLLDKEQRTGAREVCSLYRLVCDMGANRNLLTRQGILGVLDYPYAYEEGLENCYRALMRHESAPEIMKYKHSASIHKNIDLLTGVPGNQRSPGDAVRPEILEWLKARLDACGDIYGYVNKLVAHPATPDSRSTLASSDVRITLGRLFDAHKIICETAQFVGLSLFYHSFGNFLVSCAYDQFEHFEKPWASEDTVTKLREFWHQYDKATRQWNNWDSEAEFNKASANV